MENVVTELACMVALLQDRDRVLGEKIAAEMLLGKFSHMTDANNNSVSEIIDVYLDQLNSLKTELNAANELCIEKYGVEPGELRFIAAKLKARIEVHEETYEELVKRERVFEILEAGNAFDVYDEGEGREKLLLAIETLKAQEAFSRATILTNLFPKKEEEVSDE